MTCFADQKSKTRRYSVHDHIRWKKKKQKRKKKWLYIVCVIIEACMLACMRVVMSLGLPCEAWGDASSDVTRRRRWWWCGQFLRGDQEYPAPRYHPPSGALHRAASNSLVMRRSTHVTQLFAHTSLRLIGVHLLSGLYPNFMNSHKLQQLFLIAWLEDEQKPETVRAEQCSSEEWKEKLRGAQVSFLANNL